MSIKASKKTTPAPLPQIALTETESFEVMTFNYISIPISAHALLSYRVYTHGGN